MILHRYVRVWPDAPKSHHASKSSRPLGLLDRHVHGGRSGRPDSPDLPAPNQVEREKDCTEEEEFRASCCTGSADEPHGEWYQNSQRQPAVKGKKFKVSELKVFTIDTMKE